MKSLLLIPLLAASAAASLPAGSFQGSSPLAKGPDVMAFLVRRDPASAERGWALLAEYTRLPYIPGPERLEITRWVPRLYAFKLEPLGGLRYAVRPLRVSASGEIEADPGYYLAGTLTLAKAGTMNGATLERFDRGSVLVAERIVFQGKVSSTWEGYVPGNYFWTRDNTGGDYFKKDVNTVLRKDQVAEFSTPEVSGAFRMTEKAPGMFTFAPEGSNPTGSDKVLSRIGVFVDIVNWKPFFTTDELLLVNPDDPKDVGFFYERH